MQIIINFINAVLIVVAALVFIGIPIMFFILEVISALDDLFRAIKEKWNERDNH